MKEFILAALPWICIGIAVALFAANHSAVKKPPDAAIPVLWLWIIFFYGFDIFCIFTAFHMGSPKKRRAVPKMIG